MSESISIIHNNFLIKQKKETGTGKALSTLNPMNQNYPMFVIVEGWVVVKWWLDVLSVWRLGGE